MQLKLKIQKKQHKEKVKASKKQIYKFFVLMNKNRRLYDHFEEKANPNQKAIIYNAFMDIELGKELSVPWIRDIIDYDCMKMIYAGFLVPLHKDIETTSTLPFSLFKVFGVNNASELLSKMEAISNNVEKCLDQLKEFLEKDISKIIEKEKRMKEEERQKQEEEQRERERQIQITEDEALARRLQQQPFGGGSYERSRRRRSPRKRTRKRSRRRRSPRKRTRKKSRRRRSPRKRTRKKSRRRRSPRKRTR